MTPRSMFNIILKVLGLLLVKDILALTPQLLSVFIYLTREDLEAQGIWTLVFSMTILFVYCLVSFWLIFRSNYLIDKLKLSSGFDQEIIPLNIHRSTILSISIIVIGGLMLTEEIPNLCRQLFYYFQEKRMTDGMTNPFIIPSVIAGIKIFIGLLLVVGQRQIVNFIEKQRKK